MHSIIVTPPISLYNILTFLPLESHFKHAAINCLHFTTKVVNFKQVFIP